MLNIEIMPRYSTIYCVKTNIGIVIKFISIELTGRVSSIFPLKLIVFISSALISRPIFSFSVTSEATTPVKLDSMCRRLGCER